jgi:hypothetical protein
MKMLSKKALASLIAGTFIMAGAVSPFTVQAADIEAPPAMQDKGGPGCQRQGHNPQEMAQHLADDFGIDQATVLQYSEKGMNFRDIGQAAMLANASGQSLDTVISHKTYLNSWKDVADKLGVTKEQMKTAHQNIIANSLNKKSGVNKQTAINLLQQGYHPRDIGMASELAKNTGKTLGDILAMKKINNTWLDVATILGVNQDTFNNDAKELGFGFHHGHGPGPSANGVSGEFRF